MPKKDDDFPEIVEISETNLPPELKEVFNKIKASLPPGVEMSVGIPRFGDVKADSEENRINTIVAEKARRELGDWALDKIKAGTVQPSGLTYAFVLTAVAMFYMAARGQRGKARDTLEEAIDDCFGLIEKQVADVPGLHQQVASAKGGDEITAAFAKFVGTL